MQPDIGDIQETSLLPDAGEAAWLSIGPWERRRHFDALLAFGEDDIWLIGWDRPILRWNGEALVDLWSSDEKIYAEGIWGTDPTNVWVCGGIWEGEGVGEFLARWDGTGWTLHETGFEVTLSGIWGTDDGRLWALAPQGVVLTYDGETWTQTSLEADPSVAETVGLRSIWGSSPEDIWVVGRRGTELHAAVVYHWNGTSWTKPSIPQTEDTLGGFSTVWGSGPDDVWIGAWNDLGYSPYDEPETPAVHWDGSQWSTVDTGVEGSYRWVGGAGPDDVWVAGSGGVHHWDGAAWAEVDASGGGGAIAAHDPDNAWMATDSGVLHQWDGDAWTQLSWPIPNLVAIEGTTDRIWVTGSSGAVASMDDEGWIIEHPAQMTDFHDLWLDADGQPWVAGANGVVLRKTTGGWESLEAPTDKHLYGIWGSSAEDVWVVGGTADYWSSQQDTGEGVVLRWNGESWEEAEVPVAVNRLAVAGAGPEDVWIVGVDLIPVHWDGADWTPHPLPVESMSWGSRLDRVFIDPVGRVWVSGQRRAQDVETEIGIIGWYEAGVWTTSDMGETIPTTVAALWGDGVWTFGSEVHADLWSVDAQLVDLEIEEIEESFADFFGLPSGDLWAAGRRGQVFHRQVQ